jgi:di/tricarboxylate transporter
VGGGRTSAGRLALAAAGHALVTTAHGLVAAALAAVAARLPVAAALWLGLGHTQVPLGALVAIVTLAPAANTQGDNQAQLGHLDRERP